VAIIGRTVIDVPDWLPFAGFVIPVFSALRLAKFNIDKRQTSSFLGLAVPANALFFGGLAYSYSDFFSKQPYLLIAITVIFSVLLISEIPMFSLKFKNLKWKDNSAQFIFLGGCVLLIIFLKFNAFAPIIVWYIVLAIIFRTKSKYCLKKW